MFMCSSMSLCVCVCPKLCCGAVHALCCILSSAPGGADDPGPAMAVALALFWNVSFLLLLLAQVTGYPGAVEV